MTYFRPLFCLTVFLTSVQPVFSRPMPTDPNDTAHVVAPGATPRLISDQFSFTEGPAVDKEGRVYFTDQPNDKIWLYDLDGTLSVFMDKTGRSNGLYVDKRGNLIACADQHNELWAIGPDGKITVLLKEYEGKRLNGPNDLWIDPRGGIYFTDPYYQRDYWTRKAPDIDGQHVYYLPSGQQRAIRVTNDLVQPNGIVGTPDGKHLYVADIKDNKTYKYDIAPDGRLTNRRLLVAQGSDGITLDNRGNLYLTGQGVTVYNPAGQKIDTIAVPARWVGNVCFGGKDRRTLIITASEAVYALPMRVQGVE